MVPFEDGDGAKKEPAADGQYRPFYVVDDLLRAMALEPCQFPLIAYPKSERGLTDFEHFTALDLDRLTDLGVKSLMSRGLRAVTVCIQQFYGTKASANLITER